MFTVPEATPGSQKTAKVVRSGKEAAQIELLQQQLNLVTKMALGSAQQLRVMQAIIMRTTQ
eukprot:6656589-Karenia_brevis.AAC.1